MSDKKRTRSKNNARGRVDIPALLTILRHIARHGGVASPELQELTGRSRATMSRILADAQDSLGVKIVWRMDMSLPSHGEYSIEDWGILDSRRVLAKKW